MARNKLSTYVQNDFRGGINREIEEAAPNQVEDARNVWGRFGQAEQRPGYVGITSLIQKFPSTSNYDAAYHYDLSLNTFNDLVGNDPFTATGLDVGDILYFGFDAADINYFTTHLLTDTSNSGS